MQKMFTEPMPADVDSSVFAAGPLIGGDGYTFRRVVLREVFKDPAHGDAKEYVVHDQQYPLLEEGSTKPNREYVNGDYYGDDPRAGFIGFVKRLMTMGTQALGISLNEMLPEDGAYLPKFFEASERGNVVLTAEKDFAAWISLGGDLRLSILYINENYPALRVRLVRISDTNLVDLLHSEFGGWHVHKANLNGVRVDADGDIDVAATAEDGS